MRIFLLLGILSLPSILAQGLSGFNDCALKCLSLHLAESNCTLDAQCYCKDDAFLLTVRECVLADCTIKEGLASQKSFSELCNKPIRDRSNQITISAWVWLGICIVATAMRIIARLPIRKQPHTLWWDDLLIVIAVVISISLGIFVQIEANHGLGKDIWEVPFDNITYVLHAIFIGLQFYQLSLTFTKLSILTFLLRIFQDRKFRFKVWAVFGVVCASQLVVFFVVLFQCNPISDAWTKWDVAYENSNCINLRAAKWIGAVCGITTDILILILPLPQIIRLQMPWKSKLQVILMFTVGTFVTFVSIGRLWSLAHYADSQNPTWDYVPAIYWSTVEAYVGILCACCPGMKMFMQKYVSFYIRKRETPSQVELYSDTNGSSQNSQKKTNATSLYRTISEQ